MTIIPKEATPRPVLNSEKPAAPSPLVLDLSVGHAPDPGWQGAKSRAGLSEYHFNNKILRPALAEALKGSGIEPRFWDAAEHPEWRRVRKGNLLLLDRLISIFNKTKEPAPKIAIALHNNAARNRRYGGFMVIYRREKDGTIDSQSKLLSDLLVAELERSVPLKNRGSQPDQDVWPGSRPAGYKASWVGRNLAFCRWCHRKKVAGVILELGFLTCEKDVKVLQDPMAVMGVAQAIKRATQAFVANKEGTNQP